MKTSKCHAEAPSRKVPFRHLVVLGGLLAMTATADSWEFTGPNRVGPDLFGVAHGPDGFMAVGAGGLVGTSADGRSWEFQQLGDGDTLIGCVSVGGLSVAVGARAPFDGRGVVWISADRRNWRRVVSDSPTALTRVIHADGRFASVGGSGWAPSGGVTGLSVDGRTWTWRAQTFPASYLKDLAWTGTGFLRSGASGISSGSDGLQWSPVAATTTQPTGMAIRGDTVVVTERWGGVVVSHDRGRTWTARPLPGNHPLGILGYFDVAAGPEGFVAVGDNGGLRVSPDGDTWTVAQSGTDQLLEDAVHGDGRWIVVGRGGVILTSTDAREWEPVSIPGPNFRDVAFGAGRFVAVTPEAVWTSTDGRNWESRPGDGADAVAFGGNRFVSVGAQARTSTDGLRWTTTKEFGERPMSRIAYGGGRFLAAGGNNALNFFDTWGAMSGDGSSWTSVPVPRIGNPATVAYSNSRFGISGGPKSSVGTALLDTQGTPIGGLGAPALAGGRHGFLSLRWNGDVLADGVDMGVSLTSSSSLGFQSDGLYAVFGGTWKRPDGSRPVVWISTNLHAWRAIQPPRSSIPNGMAIGNGRLVLVGNGFIASRSLSGPLLEASSPSMELDEGVPRLRWSVLPGHRYGVETSTDGRRWSSVDIGTNTPAGPFSTLPSEQSLAIPGTDASRWFRLRTQPE